MRRRLLDTAHRRFGLDAPWVRRHVASCPKCQQRLAGLTKVDLALSVIKSQPHRLDLLTRANTAAIRMLSPRPRTGSSRPGPNRRSPSATPEPRAPS
jgi:hypothetical protein